jgi:hypothetical protein
MSCKPQTFLYHRGKSVLYPRGSKMDGPYSSSELDSRPTEQNSNAVLHLETDPSGRKCKHYSVISVANYMFRRCNWHLIRYNYTVYECFLCIYVDENVDCDCLGCDAIWSCKELPTFRQNISLLMFLMPVTAFKTTRRQIQDQNLRKIYFCQGRWYRLFNNG